METKKSIKANLEKKRPIFFQIGLALVLGMVVLAFEWTSYTETTHDLGTLVMDDDDEELIPVTRTPDPPPPPPPPPAPAEILKIVDDKTLIITDPIIANSEITPNEPLEIIAFDPPDPGDDEPMPFAIIEEPPMFPGGDAALLRYLASETRYPDMAREMNIVGKVYVGFVIEKDGSVSSVKILRAVDPILDKEAMRVVSSMPNWSPGKQRGKSVRVSYQVPLNFKLSQ